MRSRYGSSMMRALRTPFRSPGELRSMPPGGHAADATPASESPAANRERNGEGLRMGAPPGATHPPAADRASSGAAPALPLDLEVTAGGAAISRGTTSPRR